MATRKTKSGATEKKPMPAAAPPRAPLVAVPVKRAGEVPKAPGPKKDAGVIIVTGISGNLGRLLAKKLHRTENIIGIDRRPFLGRPKDLVHHRIDLRRKKCEDIFRQNEVKAVIHIGISHNPRIKTRDHHSWNVGGTLKLFDYCVRYKVPRVVLMSTASVYGPQPDNPGFLTEEAPLLASQTFPAIRDLVELDMLGQSFFWKHPSTRSFILRPVHIVGPDIKNAPSNYLRLPRIPTVMGFDPLVQLIHADDLADAMIRCLYAENARGIFNLAGPGVVPISKLLRALGRPTLPVPGFLFQNALEVMWRVHLTSFPPPELDHIRYTATVDGSRAERELGVTYKYNLLETVRSVLA